MRKIDNSQIQANRNKIRKTKMDTVFVKAVHPIVLTWATLPPILESRIRIMKLICKVCKRRYNHHNSKSLDESYMLHSSSLDSR